MNFLVFEGMWIGDRQIKRAKFKAPFNHLLEGNPSNWSNLVDPAYQYPNSAIEVRGDRIAVDECMHDV